jgi:hypothetical protein
MSARQAIVGRTLVAGGPSTKLLRLRAEMAFTVDPMVNLGGPEVRQLADGLDAGHRRRPPPLLQLGHTVLVTRDEPVEEHVHRQTRPRAQPGKLAGECFLLHHPLHQSPLMHPQEEASAPQPRETGASL